MRNLQNNKAIRRKRRSLYLLDGLPFTLVVRQAQYAHYANTEIDNKVHGLFIRFIRAAIVDDDDLNDACMLGEDAINRNR